MYLSWKFNNEAKDISLEEFERENEFIFGFIMLKLGDYQLGYIAASSPYDEGDENISSYVISLIKCGIVLYLGQEFKIQLLSSNLLDLQAKSNGTNVYIKVVHNESGEVEYSYEILFKDLIEEIKDNYHKYIGDIQKMNSDLLESRIVKLTNKYYEILMKLLH